MGQPQNELTRNAITRARNAELSYFQRALDTQWLNNRMEDGRMGRCLALIEKEAQMEKEFQERTDHAAIVNARAKKEADLATEIAQLRHDENIELLRRHYLRGNDQGLKTLMRKLQAGYVCRDLQQQILHNEYKRQQNKAEEDRANSTLLTALGDYSKEQQAALQKVHKIADYRRDLQQQLVDKQRVKQCQYEDALIEQKMLDDVMRTISDEDQRELKQKRELTQKMQQEMVTFKQARDAWRAKQRIVAIEEEVAIEKQKAAAADRSASIVAEKKRKEAIKDAINAKICAQILADQEEQADRDNIIKSLQENELIEKNLQDDIAKAHKLEQVRDSTKADLTAQMNLKIKEREQQRKRDFAFRKESEAKLAAADAKENEKERLKKERARQYSIDLKKQIENNAKRREKDKRFEDERNKAALDKSEWDAEVSKEREKIISQHVPPILGYIQAGVLSAADLPAVRAGADLRPELRPLDIESMAAKSKVNRHPKCNAQCRIIRDF